ncbi:hypothetical protein A4X09_0g5586 [Tilletia walkeri]|uniref:Uncharacterized protein n=1 Tax=Tilletia walkeri TaxID=117179 RepID=A0A8X7N6P3_9BASI|nr:hypothetical protein A4X09_0g5586 [Tilletia walkeri]
MRFIISTTAVLFSVLASSSLALPYSGEIIVGGVTIARGPGRPSFISIAGPPPLPTAGGGLNGRPLIPKLFTTQVNNGVTTVSGPGIFRTFSASGAAPTSTADVADAAETDTADDSDAADTDTDTDVAPQITQAPASRPFFSPATGAAAPGVYGASGIALVAGAVAIGAALVAM